MSPFTISELNKKEYVPIEDWRNRLLQGGQYSYADVDGSYLRGNWGEFENVAIAVNGEGNRESLGAAEGMKEEEASWGNFFQWLCGRGLDGVELVVTSALVCGKPWKRGPMRPNTNGVQSTLIGVCLPLHCVPRQGWRQRCPKQSTPGKAKKVLEIKPGLW